MLSDKSRVVPGSRPVAVREIQLIDRDKEMEVSRKAAEKGREKFLKVERMTNQEYSEDELHLRKERLTLGKL